MRIHWGYLCNEAIGIGKRKWGIPLQVTLDSTGKLHLLVYRIVCFFFYLFKDDKLLTKQRKWLVGTKEEKMRKAHLK